MQKTKGFTLVELLSVIAIIGILAGVVITATRSVRKTAEAAQCSSQLRQVYAAISLYAQNNKGVYMATYTGNPALGVSGIYWYEKTSPLRDYVGMGAADSWQSIVVCPSNRTEQSLGVVGGKYIRNDYGWPYTTNYGVMPDSAAVAVKASSIGSPPKVVMMVDANPDTWGLGFGWNTLNRIGTPHSGRSNVLYCDGHVEVRSVDSITATVY